MSLKDASNLQECLIELARESLLHSACDVSDGGIFVALAKAALERGIGIETSYVEERPSTDFHADVFWTEESNTVVVSCRPEDTKRVIAIAEKWEANKGAYKIGTTVKDSFIVSPFFNTTVNELASSYAGQLESQLAAEVVTA
jgi:phosphoribosylformylglycinamidine synthase